MNSKRYSEEVCELETNGMSLGKSSDEREVLECSSDPTDTKQNAVFERKEAVRNHAQTGVILAKKQGQEATPISTTSKAVEAIDINVDLDSASIAISGPQTRIRTNYSNSETISRSSRRSNDEVITSEFYRAFIEFIASIHPRRKHQFVGSIIINPCLEDDEQAKKQIKRNIDFLRRKLNKQKIAFEYICFYEKTERSTLHANIMIMLPRNYEYLIEEFNNLPVVHTNLFSDKSDVFRSALYFLKQRRLFNKHIEGFITESIHTIVSKALGDKLYSVMLRRMAEHSNHAASSRLTCLHYERAVPFVGSRVSFSKGLRPEFNKYLKKSMRRQNENNLNNGRKRKHSVKKINRLVETPQISITSKQQLQLPDNEDVPF